jgi:hypothetical protein
VLGPPGSSLLLYSHLQNKQRAVLSLVLEHTRMMQQTTSICMQKERYANNEVMVCHKAAVMI